MKEVIDLIANSNGGFLIGKIKQIQGRVFGKLLTECGIDQFNGAQGRILFVLWQNDDIPISELSRKTGLAKTTLTGMLDRMAASGQITRTLDPDDRRKTNICLSDSARDLQSRYEAVSLRMNDIFYSGFSDEEIRHFELNLERILTNLTNKESF